MCLVHSRQPLIRLAKESEYSIETAGEADHIKLTTITDPTGWKADGADIAMVQVEVVTSKVVVVRSITVM